MAASRTPRKRETRTDGVILAQLDGTAGYAVYNKLPLEEAVQRLLGIAPGRRDLLAEAAGTALGSWEGNPVGSWAGWMKADLMVAAGADLELMEPHRLDVYRRVKVPTHSNPSSRPHS
jgi:hypothetical protein